MMKHKHLLSLVLLGSLVFSLPVLTQAQNAPATDSHSGKKGCKFKEALGLSDDQTAKLKPIFKSEREEMSALKGDTSLTKQEKHQQIKAIRDKYKSEIAAILTPDQLTKLQALKQERREKKNGESAVAPKA